MGGRGAASDRHGGDLGRSVVVIAEDAELAVALRDRLDRTFVTVVDTRTEEAVDAVRLCRPRAWMVIGAVSQLPEGLLGELKRRPTLLLWRGAAPAGLPRHVRSLPGYAQLAAAVETALAADVAGMRLAPGGGLTMPDGGHAANPTLEVLVAGHPEPVDAPAPLIRAAGRALRAHGVALTVARTASEGARLVGTA